MFAGKKVKPQAAPLQFAEASKEKQVQPKQEAKAAGPLAGTGSQLAGMAVQRLQGGRPPVSHMASRQRSCPC